MILTSLVQNLRYTVCAMALFSTSVIAHDLPLEKLNLPDGFEISVYAELLNPRQLAISENGIVFAGSFRAGNIYAIINDDADHEADKVITIDKGLKMPTGLALRDGDLYVGAVDKILVYRNIVNLISQDKTLPTAEVVYAQLPDKEHHGWKYLDFGPDGQLYFNIGAPCNVCKEDNPWFASIMRLDLSASPLSPELYASGIRNTVGITWHPESNDLWFTDNGRDMLGDEIPPCELNRADRAGLHFGFPYEYGDGEADPEFGPTSMDTVKPEVSLGAHVAPLGLKFYQGSMFPSQYQGDILIAEHGSWNRTPEAGHVGYRLTRVNPETGAYSVFIDGWLQDNIGWGRPADLLEMKDGSLLIADDTGNAIYRVTYTQP